MNQIQVPDYDDLDLALHRARADAEAAESHGMLCALLCVGPHRDPDDLINEEILAGQADSPEVVACREQLRALWRQTGRELAGGDYTVRLLLPEDDVGLWDRSDALAAWCSGFLYGLGLSGETVLERLGEESREFVDDLSECTRLERGDDYTEEDETAFIEIVEYVRIGLQAISQDLLPRQNVNLVQETRH